MLLKSYIKKVIRTTHVYSNDYTGKGNNTLYLCLQLHILLTVPGKPEILTIVSDTTR